VLTIYTCIAILTIAVYIFTIERTLLNPGTATYCRSAISALAHSLGRPTIKGEHCFSMRVYLMKRHSLTRFKKKTT